MKPKGLMIFIDGQDRCGKSSIVDTVFHETNMIHKVIDRGILSNIVYSKINSRNVDLDSYYILYDNPSIINIYLTCSISEFEKRTIKSNDYGVPLDKIKTHKKIWDEEFEKIKDFNNVFKIDNTNLTIRQTIGQIIKIIKQHEVN